MLDTLFALALALGPGAGPAAKPAPDLALRAALQDAHPGIKTLVISGQEYRVYYLDCDVRLTKALEKYLGEDGADRHGTQKTGKDIPYFKSYMD